MGHTIITMRRTAVEDLESLFLFQLDEEANYLAAFTAENPADKAAYLKKYTPFLSDPTIRMSTMLLDGRVIGSIAKFEIEGQAEISYWIDKAYWGKGITTSALKDFLQLETARPIRGRVAFDNYGSQRVLEKCGFVRTGTDRGFARARQEEIEEFIYKLL